MTDQDAPAPEAPRGEDQAWAIEMDSGQRLVLAPGVAVEVSGGGHLVGRTRPDGPPVLIVQRDRWRYVAREDAGSEAPGGRGEATAAVRWVPAPAQPAGFAPRSGRRD